MRIRKEIWNENFGTARGRADPVHSPEQRESRGNHRPFGNCPRSQRNRGRNCHFVNNLNADRIFRHYLVGELENLLAEAR